MSLVDYVTDITLAVRFSRTGSANKLLGIAYRASLRELVPELASLNGVNLSRPISFTIRCTRRATASAGVRRKRDHVSAHGRSSPDPRSILPVDMTETIKRVVHEITGARQVLLFGSRARGDHHDDSDYDVMAILDENTSVRDRIRLASRCRAELAALDIDADVLVKGPDEIRDYSDKRGSVVYEALAVGIPL